MLEDPKHRQGGLRYLLSVLEHPEVARDAKGAWWLANRHEERLVNLICIPSLAEAMDVSKRLITKQQELEKALVDVRKEAELRIRKQKMRSERPSAKQNEPLPENNYNEDFPGEYDTSSSPARSRIFREPQGLLCPIDHIAAGND